MAFILTPTSKISNVSFSKGIDDRATRDRTTLPTFSTVPLDTPFTIIIDTAEQLPFNFNDIHADAAKLYRPFVVKTVRRHLRLPGTRLSIDYSIEKHELTVGIERKSHEDFCNTLAGRHRRRFERKLSIINATFVHFAIVVEAEWSTILYDPPPHSSAVPRTLFRTVITWMTRFPTIHWLFLPNRRLAEKATFRVLERWWKELNVVKPRPKPDDSNPTLPQPASNGFKQ